MKTRKPNKIEITVTALRDGGYFIKWKPVSLIDLFKPYHLKAFSTQTEMLDFVAETLAIL